ncbi:MAG: SDR family oxidoreductase [Hyphomonas sp.]|uniref:SDR family oxidoreductase n=1 Tax=Hyphomonas sp. TaxID=87 RepID=UPI0032968FF4
MPDTVQNQYEMRDPRAQYPKPPFPKQPQEKPGFDHKMEPKADHGEDSYKGFGRLKGRKALITGGDSGIGRAVAIAYAREGAEICINYLPEEKEDADWVCDLLEGEGHTVHRMPGNLTDKEFCNSLIKDAHEKMGGLDILVNNAGKQVRQPGIEDISDEQFDETMKTNVYAMFWLSKAALPLMPPGAAIINVTSNQGFSPAPYLLDYATTKFAIRGFTEALAQGALDRGVRVNGVAPGPFWTPLQPSGGQTQEKVQEFGKATPMGRPGQPAELAPTFVFLASQESSYISGEIIGVTGGKPIS